MTNRHPAALACLGLLFSAASQAAGPYYALRLDAPRDSMGFSVSALNDAGQVAGTAWGDQRRAVVSEATGQNIRSVRTPNEPGMGYQAEGLGITADGRVVGDWQGFGNPVGFYTDRGGLNWTPVLPPPAARSAVFTAVSPSGLATGYAIEYEYTVTPIIGRLRQRFPEVLGRLGGSKGYGLAISPEGRVAGKSETGLSDHPVQAFITDVNGQNLRALEPTPTTYISEARAINDSGWVAGVRRSTMTSTDQAFVFHPTTGMRELALAPGSDGAALGMDAQGRVVGFSRNAAGDLAAFVTEPEGGAVVDLNSVTEGVPRRTRLMIAFAINGRGQIAASDSHGHGYLLCPTPDCR